MDEPGIDDVSSFALIFFKKCTIRLMDNTEEYL